MKDNNFEKNIEELENIVKELEEGKLDLEKSVEKFEEGMKISKNCNDILESAEKRITILLENNGEIKETQFEN